MFFFFLSGLFPIRVFPDMLFAPSKIDNGLVYPVDTRASFFEDLINWLSSLACLTEPTASSC